MFPPELLNPIFVKKLNMINTETLQDLRKRQVALRRYL